TDIVKSTNLLEAIGDEAWQHLLRWHDQTLRSLFSSHGGEEVKQVGDGFVVAFANASESVEAAVAIQRALAEHRKAHGFSPQVRIGLHTAEVTRKGMDYEGRGVHEAARIGALAEGGEILASTETYSAGNCRFPASAQREVSLKGISNPIEIVSIDWR
ncbi:MAG: adenylate/guanylate cyclase domain-containing protein, partial [Acidimicrobiia bacterium]